MNVVAARARIIAALPTSKNAIILTAIIGARLYVGVTGKSAMDGRSVTMTIDEIKARLLDLAQDRQSFFTDDGTDDVFRADYDALMAAVDIMREKIKATEEDIEADIKAQLFDYMFGRLRKGAGDKQCND